MLIKFLFTLIFGLAIFLRFWDLDNIPPSLNWDEVSLGYNAYSIFKTGKDEWGELLPLTFRSYGDYKLPAYVYLDIPFIALFGLNEWGVRLPSAVLGIGSVLVTFLILKSLVNIKVALWGAFIASILPWTIILSRIALEAQLALFLTTLGVYFFLKALQEKSYLAVSFICFGLTIFTYNASRIVTPLLVLILVVLYRGELLKIKQIAGVSLFIFILISIVALPKALLQDSSARYRWTHLLDEGAINRINEQRGSSDLPPFLSRLSNNKVTYFLTESSKNYISHYSPDFLFVKGGSNYQFSVPRSGLVYPALAPFIILGFWSIFKQRKKWQLFILAWFFIAPIPAAITRDSPHALRSIMMVLPLLMIITQGISYCFNDLNHWIKKNEAMLSFVVAATLFISLYTFWQNYSGSYVKNYSWSWQFGYKQVVRYVVREGEKYDKIYVTKKYGEPHEFLLFYLKYDPKQYIEGENLIRYERSDWFWVDRFDKFAFINDWEVMENVKCQMSNVKCLLITSPDNYPLGSKPIHTINFLDGQKAFDIVILPQVQ